VYLEEELKRALLDAVRLVFEGDLLPRLGLPRRRGLLLCGPPGNGKTLCLRALLHTYPDASLLYLVRPETGVGSWALEQLLEDAGELLRRGRRCLIALEDVEVFFERAQERSAFLNALDGLFQGVPPQGALVVVATTNYPEKLDAALLQRPHRFDRVFVLHSPGAELRRRYLRTKAQIPLRGEELEELVRQTEGLSFAYLQELVVSAHYAAAFANEPLRFRHYREAARQVARQRERGEALERSGLVWKGRVGFLPAEEE
jgi:SpoVK/Ycf46/Vps4 family AAA+-type ATPase